MPEQDIDRRRHMLRVWVAPLEDRPLPAAYKHPWDPSGKFTPGLRGGIRNVDRVTVPLEAE